MMVKLSCGCVFSEERKCCIKRCRIHLNQEISVNLQKERKLHEQIEQQQILRKQQKSNTFRIKPLFLRDNRRFKPLF